MITQPIIEAPEKKEKKKNTNGNAKKRAKKRAAALRGLRSESMDM
ncbi:hypothetical protein V2J09_005338 [Rumex salicifolius]